MHGKGDIWGPYAWKKFHKRALKFGCMSRNIEAIVYFYHYEFKKYIKCKSCRRDYKSIIRQIPIRVGSPTELFCWTVEIHNIINVKLCKPVMNCATALQIWNN